MRAHVCACEYPGNESAKEDESGMFVINVGCRVMFVSLFAVFCGICCVLVCIAHVNVNAARITYASTFLRCTVGCVRVSLRVNIPRLGQR